VGAVSSEGEKFISISESVSTTETTRAVLVELVQQLEGHDENWRENTLLLMDNASYHKSKGIKDLIEELTWCADVVCSSLFTEAMSD